MLQRNPNSLVFKNLFNQLNRRVSKAVAAEKQKQWQEACDKLDHRNGSSIWKQFKRLAGNGKSSFMTRVCDSDGNLTKDDVTTAQTLADHLAKCHTVNQGPYFNQEFYTQVTDFVSHNSTLFIPQLQVTAEPGDDDTGLLGDITTTTLLQIRKKVRKSAPGSDKITYDILKRCHLSVFHYLAKLFQQLRNIGYFPINWKAAIGVMIPKPGKDTKVPGNNRPISLLLCISKLFEKCIARPLIDHLIDSQFMNPWQRAYLPGKEANEHLFRFYSFNKLACDSGWTSAAILLDVEKAFDSVWQDGLRFKLSQMELPNKITRLLSSFLDQRSIAVRVGNSVSRQVQLQAGTPQGSVLSPLLFNIFVNDIPFTSNSDVQISQFADDLAFWYACRSTTKRGYGLIRKKLQGAMDSLESWCSDWRIRMNPTKCQLLYFSRSNKTSPFETDGSVTLFDTPIPIVREAKLLGLTVTAPRMTLIKHCQNIREKAESRIKLLRSVRGTLWGANIPTLLTLYKTFIRPVLETGYVATAHNKKCTSILSVAENKALRIALKIRYTPGERRTTNAELHRRYGEPPIAERLEILREKACNRFEDSPLIEDLDHRMRCMAWMYRGPCTGRPPIRRFIEFMEQNS